MSTLNSKISKPEQCNVVTYDGLHCCYVKLIEKYGRIILYFSETCTEKETLHRKSKVENYIKELEHLIFQCQRKLSLLVDEDKKDDILIIHDKVTKFHSNITPFLIKLLNQ